MLTVAVDPVQVILGSTLGDFGVLKLASIIDAGTLLGNGPGTATIGARYFGPIWELTENYFANAYYELGPFGLVAIGLVVLTVPTVTLRAWRAEQDAFFRTVLAAMVVYQAAIIVISIAYSPLAYPPSACSSGSVQVSPLQGWPSQLAERKTRGQPAPPILANDPGACMNVVTEDYHDQAGSSASVMRVLLYSHYFAPGSGGLATFSDSLASTLGPLGVTVRLATASDKYPGWRGRGQFIGP